MKESTLDKIHSRPRFKMATRLSQKELIELLKTALEHHSEQFSGNVNPEIATIKVNSETSTYWQPQLSLRLEQENGVTIIRGMFGPSPSIWTFFMFMYFGSITLTMVCATLWLIEKQIGSNYFPWAIYITIIGILLLLITYTASHIGKIKAKSEMKQLREFIINTILKFEKKSNES